MEIQPLVPQEWCLRCRRCCRFADPEDAQTPAFSVEEVRRASAAGASSEWFRLSPQPPSHEIRVVPHPCGGAQCPALEPGRHQCRIYPSRPLDCQLYPFVVTRDASQQRLLLAVDTKCPYVQQLGPGRALQEYGWYLTRLLESPAGQRILVENPALAGRPRGEFLTVSPLRDPSPPAAPEPPPGFAPLASRWAEFDRALEASGRPLSVYHRAAWAAWQDLMRLWWGPIGDHSGVLTEQAGGYFFALPPLGSPLTHGVVEHAFTMLDALNHGAPVSRIENLSVAAAEQCRAWGYVVRPVEQEYVYERTALEQRLAPKAARAMADGRLTVRPYRPSDAEACLRVYAVWALTRQAEATDPSAKAMLRDGFYAHRRWLEETGPLEIHGWVIERAGAVCGYTLGVPLSSETFVVLAEITTRDPEDLDTLLALTVCRAVPQPRINAMGDAGLPALTRRKLAGQPCTVSPVFSAARSS